MSDEKQEAYRQMIELGLCPGEPGEPPSSPDLQAEINRLTDKLAEAEAKIRRVTGVASQQSGCKTCLGTRRIHVVEGACQPARDIDCPTCVGVPIAGAPGVHLFSTVPPAAPAALEQG